MRPLALHHVTLFQASAPDCVKLAYAAGYQGVCIFTSSPSHPNTHPPEPIFPLVTRDNLSAFKDALVETGLTVWNAEYFPIGPGIAVAAYEPAISLAAEVGAKTLVTHIVDADVGKARAEFTSLCKLAAQYGLSVAVEFTGMAPGCNSLQSAVALIETTGADNAGIGLDPLHLARTGCDPEDILGIDPALISYAQICDGAHLDVMSDYMAEALNRMLPGEGVFPLKAFVDSLAATIPIDVEVPQTALRNDQDILLAHATKAIQASRLFVQ